MCTLESLTFVRMPCCDVPINAHPHGRRISAIPHVWGRPRLHILVRDAAKTGNPAWAGGGFDAAIARGLVSCRPAGGVVMTDTDASV